MEEIQTCIICSKMNVQANGLNALQKTVLSDSGAYTALLRPFLRFQLCLGQVSVTTMI